MPSPALLKLDHGPNSNPPSRRGSMAAAQTLNSLSMESSVQSSYVRDALKRATMQLEVLESAKRLAAYTAVDHHILPEHTVIGVGSGSTVPYVVDRIIQQGDKLNKHRVFIPTGFQSKELIVNGGLKLGDVDQYPTIDVTIDGADEVDAELNCIKGGGACHLREKVLAEAAETFIVVADYRKNTGLLGKSWKQGVPIEVAPFAYAKLLQNLHRLGSPEAKLRMAKMKAGPIVTDNGNFCIDAPFDEAYMKDPHDLLAKIKMLTGVVEVGLFCGMAKAAYFGNEDGSVSVRYENGKVETISASAIEE
ncbi:ribose 5-phosphate isomerase A [Rhizoctonia solani]|uniref:Ribose-5-phosphate isomerase n=1 Tax=Rhizoctonia solani TaxID=456999 RepID=A0A0K6FUG7_9AGAM|nr:ribose 5-phosphate isomerase A [Rhizoctonia solani]